MTQESTTRRRGHLGLRLALISLGFTALGIGATAGVSLAHNPSAVASCTDLKVSFESYENPDGKDDNNKLTVTIDGVPTVTFFGESYSHTYPWSQAVDHTWTVAIDANVVAGDKIYNWSQSGTQEACIPTSTTTPPSSTTTPPSSTTTPPSSTTTPATTTPATTTPVTTTPVTTAPPTTAPGVTTTTAVASEAPVPPAPTTTVASSGGATLVAPSTGALPATGSDTGMQLTLAMAVLMTGFGLVTITRRRANRAGRQS